LLVSLTNSWRMWGSRGSHGSQTHSEAEQLDRDKTTEAAFFAVHVSDSTDVSNRSTAEHVSIS
jgi:hypothetical protein